jgi:Arc/MetJ family transcription regulator
MDEGELMGNDPAWLLMAELAKTAFLQGNFQLAYLLDTSRGEVCRLLRREVEDLGRFMAEMTRAAAPGALAA